MAGNPPLPIWYQKEDVNDIYTQIRAGEFMSLVGIGSTGKSNLVNLVQREDVKAQYLQDEAPTTVIVVLNPHLLIQLGAEGLAHTGPAWAGYEMMLSRLRRRLVAAEHYTRLQQLGRETTVEAVTGHYLNMFDRLAALAQAGIRHLENAVYDVLALGDSWRVAFIFDEFEQFILTLPPAFFQSLRGLRDEYKGRITYITTSRKPLLELVEDQYADENSRLTFEGFVELFFGNLHYVRPLDRDSARESVRRLEQRYNNTLRLDNGVRNLLINVTGGHAGLLRRGFRPAARLRDTTPDLDGQLLRALLDDRGISDECATLINSLPREERIALRQHLHNQPITDPDAWQSLLQKHIVYEVDGERRWRIPLLSGWCRKNEDAL
jgi:hypothetical protein